MVLARARFLPVQKKSGDVDPARVHLLDPDCPRQPDPGRRPTGGHPVPARLFGQLHGDLRGTRPARPAASDTVVRRISQQAPDADHHGRTVSAGYHAGPRDFRARRRRRTRELGHLWNRAKHRGHQRRQPFQSIAHRRPFLLYAAVLALAGAALSVMLVTASVMLRGHSELLRLGLIAAVLVTMPTLFGSFYAAYRDVFPHDATPHDEATA